MRPKRNLKVSVNDDLNCQLIDVSFNYTPSKERQNTIIKYIQIQGKKYTQNLCHQQYLLMQHIQPNIQRNYPIKIKKKEEVQLKFKILKLMQFIQKLSAKNMRNNSLQKKKNLIELTSMDIEGNKPTNFSTHYQQFLTPMNQKKNRRVLKDVSIEKNQSVYRQSNNSKINNIRNQNFIEKNVHQLKKASTFEFQDDLNLSNANNTKTYYMDQMKSYITTDIPQDKSLAQMYVNHLVQQYHALQYCKQFKPPEFSELINKLLSNTQNQYQKTLVLDLDETLIHCSDSQNNKVDFQVPVQLPNGFLFEAGISVRPYCYQFLQEMSKLFEIIIFTASHKSYANQIIDKLDPQSKWVSHRLFRDNCVSTQAGMHIKDLRVLNRNLKDLVLVDNAAYSYAFQLDNGIPVIPYVDNKQDNELLKLMAYLRTLYNEDDVREQNKAVFQMRKLQQCDSFDTAVKALFL